MEEVEAPMEAYAGNHAKAHGTYVKREHIVYRGTTRESAGFKRDYAGTGAVSNVTARTSQLEHTAVPSRGNLHEVYLYELYSQGLRGKIRGNCRRHPPVRVFSPVGATVQTRGIYRGKSRENPICRE